PTDMLIRNICLRPNCSSLPTAATCRCSSAKPNSWKQSRDFANLEIEIMKSFANRVALITGAGNGIGRRLALSLAAQGASIAAVDLDRKALQSLAAELE